MKYAIIAHIFGNLDALRAVLRAIETAGVQETVCLGNVVGNRKQPDDCVTLLRERGISTLLGHLDAVACGLREPWGFEPRKLQAMMWTRDKLSNDSRVWLRRLPEQLDLPEFSAIHGSPEYLNDVLLGNDPVGHGPFPDNRRGRVRFMAYPDSPIRFSPHGTLLPDGTGTYVFGPDTDVYISPGVVGRVRKNNPPSAFGIFDSKARSYQQVYMRVS